MSKSSFIFYTLLYVAISSLFVFRAGPGVLKGDNTENINISRFEKVDEISFWYHVASDQYLNIKIKIRGREVKFQFFIPDEEYKELLNVLKENKLIKNEEDFFESVPFIIDEHELSFIKEIEVIYKKK